MLRAIIHGLINGVLMGLIGAITYDFAVDSGSAYPIAFTIINFVLGVFIIFNTTVMIDAQHRRK